MKNTTEKITASELLWRLGHSVKAAVNPDAHAIDLEHRGRRAADWNAEGRRLAFRLVVTILLSVVVTVLTLGIVTVVPVVLGLLWTAMGLRRK